MTIKRWLEQARTKLQAAGIDSARLDARILAESVLHKSRTWLLAHGPDKLTPAQRARLDQLLVLRIQRQPLAYILGTKEWYGLDFKITSDVLIPRPETETLVKAAIERAGQGASGLELGTGSGCMAVALKVNRPDLSLTAADVSASALKIARFNARRHSAKIKFVLSDLFKDVHGRFDLVLANLPYVPDGTRRQLELDYEPSLALYGGTDGLDYYRQFLPALSAHLAPGGQAIIEAGPTQRAELKILAGDAGFKLSSLSEYASLLTPSRASFSNPI